MKKVVFSLLMAIACMPMAIGQSFAGRQFITTDTTACGQFTWIDGNVYTHDTTATFLQGDTVYVLSLTMMTPTVDTNEVDLAGHCSVSWNGKTWTTNGTFQDTVASEGQCKLVTLHVNLIGRDTLNIEETACDYYAAPWGDTLRTSTASADSAFTKDGCDYVVSINLTVNPSFIGTTENVTAGCSYLWRGMTITDTEVHYDTVHVEGQCDSVFSIMVTSFSNNEYDTTQFVGCGYYYDAARHDTIRENSFFTVDTLLSGCTFHHTKKYVVIPSYTDTTSVIPTDTIGECSLTWHGHTYTSADTNVVGNPFYALEHTVQGNCDSLVAIRITAFSGEQFTQQTFEGCGRFVVARGDTIRLSETRYDTIVDSVAHCTTLVEKFYRIYDKHDTVHGNYCLYYSYRYDSITPVGGTFSLRDTIRMSGTYDTATNGRLPILTYNTINECKTYKTLVLTIRTIDTLKRDFVVVDTICDSKDYTIGKNGGLDSIITYTASTPEGLIDTIYCGIHSQTSGGKCYDSAAFFQIVVNHRFYDNYTVTACDSYTWTEFNGETYTSSINDDVERHDTLTAEGCKVMAHLNLTINYSPEVTIEGDRTLAPGETAHLRAVYNESDHPTFQWYKNGSAYSTEDHIDVTENDNTDIHLVTTSNKGCSSDNWITVTYNLGIDETEGVQVNLYPNPASRYLNVESAEGLSQVVIYNTLGQQVLSQEVNGTRTQLDLGSLATGNYSMRIVSQNGEQTTRKFIVNK